MVMLATIDDVSLRLGRQIVDETEKAQVKAWIGDVEGIITARIPTIEERIENGTPAGNVVAAVVANAVIRKIKNPDGKQNERIDDYSWGLNTTAARGELFLTDEEWALLTPDTANSGAFSIRTHQERPRGQWLTPIDWVPEP